MLSIGCFFLFETLRRFERKFSTLHQMLNDSPRDAPGIALAVYVCVCVCVFPVKLLCPLISKSCTTRWGLRGAPGIAPVSWWWHHSRRRGGCSHFFDCVYTNYITQGCLRGALAVAMSLRARCFFFPTHELGASSATSQPACYRYSSQETDLCG